MKKPIGLLATLCAGMALAVAETNLVVEAENGPSFNAGADLRVRQELMDNIPGTPGDPYSLNPKKRTVNDNHFRIRPRVWFEVDQGPLRLYARLADEFREYPVRNGRRRYDRNYTFPDEVFLDNLYLDGKALTADWLKGMGVDNVDFRVGRQDLLEGPHSVLGLDNMLAEGTPTDGSRSFFTDMARTTLHFDEVRKLDLFFLYGQGHTNLRYGNRQSEGRALNKVNMLDGNGRDEWGGGAIWSDACCDGHLPYKQYTIFKRTADYKSLGRHMPSTELWTIGRRLEPEFDDHWGMVLDGARQVGRILDGNRQKTGWYGYLEANYRPDFLRAYKFKVSLASTYYSGDKHRTDYRHDNDQAWDPLWGRYTQDSELLVYGNLWGNCWWSNMIYTKLKATMVFGPRHAMYAYSGPMFAAVQDHIGHADGGGDSMYKGWLSAARYDFPIRLAPKNASGWDRFEFFGHVVAEVFNPGDYFDSSKPSYFFRWQVDVRF